MICASTFFLALLALSLSLSIFFALSDEQRRRAFKTSLSHILPLPRSRGGFFFETPHRSPSPEESVPTEVSSETEHKDAFPPSIRESLLSLSKSLPVEQQKVFGGLQVRTEEFRKSLISFTADFRQCGPSTYTPTEVSMQEVIALGDFPDYAKLSGIPLPKPYTAFKIETAMPRPYRPFRWAYHQTMSLTKMEPDWWLELEKTYVERIKQREDLFENHGKLVLDYLPGSELACKETMETAVQFICARYPQYFSLSQQSGGRRNDEGQDRKVHVFENKILKTRTIVEDMHPLHILLHNIPEDFCVMIRNPEDGHYYFRAGVLCSSLGWNLATKLGMQLKDIHAPIPDYKEKMQKSMDRYFSKMPTSRPIQRGSWGLEIDTPLFMPPGDTHEEYRNYQLPPDQLPLSRIHLRVDWQTLRRMPLSGAILFNFKALFTPIEEFRDEPYIPALVSKVLKEGKEEIMRYKNTWHVEHVAIPALQRWSEEQSEKGLVMGEGEGEWEVRTLEEAPWFPRWREKWIRQQGFTD